MDRVPERLQGWWRGLDERQRRDALLLGLICVVYLVHYLVFCIGSPFYIEDAGISAAYARNLVNGEGLAAYPGGERVEGYSNALWTFLTAGFYALGVSAWVSTKVMGAVFGMLSLPLAAALSRRALVHLAAPPAQDSGRPPTDDLALLAPLLMALSPQIVIWNASGLENSLFGLLLLAGSWRICVEQEQESAGQGSRPWSALLFFLLTMTRPDGMMYAAIGGLARIMVAVANRRLRGLVGWVLVLVLPFVAYNGWRYWYFAWPFPNTYYAKLGAGNTFQPFGWNTRGWHQVTEYFRVSGVAYGLPLLPMAMTGMRGWRRWLGIVAIAWLAVVIGWDGRQGIAHLPDWWRPVSSAWVQLRVWSLLVWAVGLGLSGFGLRGWLPRGMLWAFAAGGIFFVVYSGNDWMKAFRWFNLIGVSMFPLLALGLAELLDGLPWLDRGIPLPRTSWRLPAWSLPTLALLVAYGAVQIANTADFAANPETSVRDIRRRVDYMKQVQRQLDIDHVTLLDVDMGAHLYFSGWRILDIAGLIEIPIARHRKYDKPFIREYIFQEEQPDFAHVHSAWARTSRIDTFQEWKEGYLEIPGYPIGGRKLHVGNNIKKSLMVGKAEVFPGAHRVAFDGGIKLVDSDIRSPIVPNGGELYTHLVFTGAHQKDGFRVLVFLDDGKGHRSVASVAPGYDWYRPEDWKRAEDVHGRYRVPVGADLPAGDYRVGVVLLDEVSGQVRALRSIDEVPVEELPGADASPVYLPGEYLLPDVTVRVTSRAEALAQADQDLALSLQQAADGDCDAAWPTFKDASRHVLKDLRWKARHEEPVQTAVAACYVARAAAADDEEDRAQALLAARLWDHHVAGLAALAEPEAARYVDEGDRWVAQQDWERAYDRYAMALKLDPSLSHVRRKAEEVRDRKLGIFDDPDAVKPAKAAPKTGPRSVKGAAPRPAKATTPSQPVTPPTDG